MPPLDLKRLLEVLHGAEVQFLLVGGVAGIAHGMNYLTTDLDICYQRTKKNYSAIVKALRPGKPRLRTKDGEIPFLFDEKNLEFGLNFTFTTDWGDIDLLGEVPGVGTFENMLPNSEEFELYGMPVKTVSLEDLIKAKHAAGRPKDKVHLLELEAIREILKGQDPK